MADRNETVIGFSLAPASVADLDAVLRLLSANDLPVAGLETHLAGFTLAKCQDELIGTAGLELYGEVALLRSLCVAESRRSMRIGTALIAAVAARAATHNVTELYLLTTGAAPYFARLGFAPCAREQAPVQIRHTAQFRSLCPASAACMRKPIGGRSPTG